MKLAVVCANGKAGRAIVKEAVSRGIEVKAFMRSGAPSEANEIVIKDLFDLSYDDLKDCNAVVDAFGAWTPEALPGHSSSLKHLCDVLSGSDIRLLVVGGAGSLYADPAQTTKVYEGSGFPEMFKPLARAMDSALTELKKRNDVRWTYISPAADFQADGERTGAFILSGEVLTPNKRGESIISYADYAIAMIDEAVKGGNIGKRISVVRA